MVSGIRGAEVSSSRPLFFCVPFASWLNRIVPAQGSADIPVRSHGVYKLSRGQKCPRSTIRGLPRLGPAALPPFGSE